VTLGQVDSGVVDRLLNKVGFSRGDSTATLGGSSWVLDSYQGPSNDYVAAVDGTGVHRADQSGAGTQGSPATTATAAATQTQTQTQAAPNATTTLSFSTTISVTRNGHASKLVRCIVRAQGDVNKILKCQEKFPP
jgi:hypothetical protein